MCEDSAFPPTEEAVKKKKSLGDYHSTDGNSQVGKGGLPPPDTLQFSFFVKDEERVLAELLSNLLGTECSNTV